MDIGARERQKAKRHRDVFDVDLLDPAGQEVNHIEDPEFVRDLFCLKLNQGGGGFRPYAFRFNFLNAMNNAVPQMLNSTCSKNEASHTRRLRLPQRVDW